MLELHPMLNPAGYVDAEFEGDRLHVHRSAAHDDGAWISLCTPGSTKPLQAIATAVDPYIAVHVNGTDTDWTLELTTSDTAAKDAVRGRGGQVQRRGHLRVRDRGSRCH